MAHEGGHRCIKQEPGVAGSDEVSHLAERGKRLSHRNALREGANRFAPSSVESVVLSVMRTALGGRKAKGPAVAARLRPEIGEAQTPLPLQGD